MGRSTNENRHLRSEAFGGDYQPFLLTGFYTADDYIIESELFPSSLRRHDVSGIMNSESYGEAASVRQGSENKNSSGRIHNRIDQSFNPPIDWLGTYVEPILTKNQLWEKMNADRDFRTAEEKLESDIRQKNQAEFSQGIFGYESKGLKIIKRSE